VSGPYDVAMTEPVIASPLGEATARVGDRWTLLLVQALLGGPRRFNELLEALPGIAPNVLSKRLKHLERERVLVGQPYSRHPPRFAYELTASGRELAGALRLLAQWGADHSGAPDLEGPRHRACGTPLEARWFCPTCARVVDDDDPGDLRFM
jgi:DNA-binding HxlR family transcriptional regulator